MIAQYPGSCTYCHRPIRVNVDEHDPARKVSFHWVCYDAELSKPPSPEMFALAGKLGFKEYSWEELESRTTSSQDLDIECPF